MYYELSAKVESPIEDIFLKDCITVGLRVVPQYKVGKYRIDFAVPEKKIAIECDGKEWHSSEKQLAQDKNREIELNKIGWLVLRLRGSDIYKNGEDIAVRIKELVSREELNRKATYFFFS